MNINPPAPFIQHVAGAYANGLQHCVVCGKVLTDNRNAMYVGDGPPPRGWPEGRVYVRGNMWLAYTPINEAVEPCTP